MNDDRTLKATDPVPGSSNAAQVFEIGRVVGDRYRIDARLGKGGMGEVWRAFDLSLQVDVALKTLTLPAQASSTDAYRREMPRREVRAARQVLSPNVCRIFDLVRVDGQELVSMEYIDGQTLTEKLQAGGALELHAATDIASQFLAGLEAIHRAGLVHRDIKPANVMVTRTGRVVVMDFGLALPALEGHTVVGTPAYMPPEQLHGGEVDARSDVFAAGVLLAELISLAGIFDQVSREGLWSSVRQSPPVMPESPWREVLERAVDPDPRKRYPSAQALARALEEVTLRAGGADDRNPYPGLAAFTAADAEFFFGREAEVETVAKKLDRPRLHAIIGPSGTGKSSFVRAGLIPALGNDWGCVLCHPGSAPFLALGQALAPELAGDTQAVRELMRFDQVEVALSVLGRWRERHKKALVVVDQFEELFTLNGEETQTQFAELLNRAALEAEIVVLLSMRDDFLYQCQPQEALRPIFSDLTPIGRLGAAATRRALVQPALLCGYRFEDESLIDEMVAEVTEERGALPLLAFAAQHLWELRDRDQGLLTRAAYEQIGGVGGALAQHAEATMKRIGNERLPVVRELFRNLVTSEGTRASRSVHELMSLFDRPGNGGRRADDDEASDLVTASRETGREVLRALVDARLLTAYEVATPDGAPEEAGQRVEIVHESLLSAWPRLVRWQTQDTDGAQLRDQLRQAAQLWEARERTEDLLWSGDSWREFQLWRTRYPGALTAVEEDYAKAMAERAGRRQRRQRLALVALVLGLLGVVGVVGTLWRQTESARRQIEAARVRDATGRLVALGRLRLEENPTGTVAYALASLEVADNPEARRLAVEALWRGPPSTLRVGDGDSWQTDFSPDGRWLVSNRGGESIELLPQDGGDRRILEIGAGYFPSVFWPDFRIGPDSDLLITSYWGEADATERTLSIRFWSFPEGEFLRVLELEGLLNWDLAPGGQSLWTLSTVDDSLLVHSWPLSGGESSVVARMERSDTQPRIDRSGSWVFDPDPLRDGSFSVRAVSGAGRELRMRHEDGIEFYYFSPDGKLLATTGPSGEIRLWSLTSGFDGKPHRILRGHQDKVTAIAFGPEGRWLASAGFDGVVRIWDLGGSPEADSAVTLQTGQVDDLVFHPAADWLATIQGSFVELWPLNRSFPRVFRGDGSRPLAVTFAPDGSWIASSFVRGTLRLWPLKESVGDPSRVVFQSQRGLLDIDVDRDGRTLLAGRFVDGTQLVPLDGREARILEGFRTQAWYVALSADGRLAAAAGGQFDPQEGVIEVWDLLTGKVQILDPGDQQWIRHLQFTPEGRLVSGGARVRIWNLDPEGFGAESIRAEGHRAESTSKSTFEIVRQGPEGTDPYFNVAVSSDGRFLASVQSGHLLRMQEISAGGEAWDVTSHGKPVLALALDASGTRLVTADPSGLIRLGPARGGAPHLLFGHAGSVADLAVSPDGRLIASAGDDATVRLWPMPEGKPFHALPYEDLLERLRLLTNMRAIADAEAQGGYRLVAPEFPGWEVAPKW